MPDQCIKDRIQKRLLFLAMHCTFSYLLEQRKVHMSQVVSLYRNSACPSLELNWSFFSPVKQRNVTNSALFWVELVLCVVMSCALLVLNTAIQNTQEWGALFCVPAGQPHDVLNERCL